MFGTLFPLSQHATCNQVDKKHTNKVGANIIFLICIRTRLSHPVAENKSLRQFSKFDYFI